MIIRELAIFFLVGSTTVLVDFLSYCGLVGFAVINVDIAKAIGFMVGTLYAYFANRYCTFGRKPTIPGSAWRFLALYTSTLGSNVLINTLALKLFADAVGAIEWAFMLATGVSASLNFLGMKLFVFKPISN